MEYSRHRHSVADGDSSFPAVSSAGLCPVSGGLYHRRTDGCAERLAGEKNGDSQPLRREAGQHSRFAVLWDPDTLAFSCFMEVVPVTIWYAVAAILLVRLSVYATAYYKYHGFAALHTRLNKLTGVAVFLLPYALATSLGVGYGWAVCLLALAAAAEELMIHLCRAEYCADRKSFFRVDLEELQKWKEYGQ